MSGSNQKTGLLDSNVIIYASKGEVDMALITSSYHSLFLSIISYVEVAGYEFDNKAEEAAILEILAQIPILPLEMDTARRAVNYRKQKKIKLPDALILATASQYNADLLTFNTRDFIDLDPRVKVVVPGTNKAKDAS